MQDRMTTVLLGLDGADPDLIKRWIDDLPNFQRVIEDGTFGDLDSIKPPITVPAWMCMIASQGPEHFDACDFTSLDTETYETDYVTSARIEGESILDSDERTSISFLIPGTTPAYPINGHMVSGYLKEELDCYPEELEDELRENTSLAIEKTKQERKDETATSFQRSFDAFLWMLEEYEFDTAVSAFQIIDFAMHNKAAEDLKDEYEQVDERLGRLLELCEDRDWNLLIASDHGSATTERKFYLNAWLREHGYLTYSDEQETASKTVLYDIADLLLKAGLKPIAKAGEKVYRAIFGHSPAPSGNVFDAIDLEQTQAFNILSSGMNWGSIYIHDQERFPDGTVEDRDSLIEEIKENLENEDFINNVYRNEDIYNNDGMPDLMVEADDDVGVGKETYPQLFHTTTAAVHNRKGLIAGIGPDIADRDDRIEADLIDVGVTIEALHGEVSAFRDGQVIEELLTNPDYETRDDIHGIDV